MQLHRIDVPMGQNNGATSVSPQNPQTNITKSPPISMRGKIAIGYGLLAARTTYQTITQEVRAGGNEELATDLENLGGALETATVLYGTGGLAAVPMGIQEIAASVVRTRTTARKNRVVNYELSLKGNRVNFNQGRAYE